MKTPAGLELATILRDLPEDWQSEHTLVEIQRAYAFGYANALWPKREAVRIAFLAAMEASEHPGKGYKAGRRAAALGERVAASVAAINRRMARLRYPHVAAVQEETIRLTSWREGRLNYHE